MPIETKPITAVSIAADVLRMLDGSEIVPTPGRYTDWEAKNHRCGPCRVCQLGAMFLTLGSEDGYYGGALFPYFPEDQLDIIEAAFEGWNEIGNLYSSRYHSYDARMRAICQNIIDNDGEFKPMSTIQTEELCNESE